MKSWTPGIAAAKTKIVSIFYEEDKKEAVSK